MSIPTAGTLKKAFDESQQKLLIKSPLYKNHLLPDINSGVIFPAFRNNSIDFYYKGGKVFSFADGKFSTHVKYASVLQGHNKAYITEKELVNAKLIKDFIGEGYIRIKENCSLYSGVESTGISNLFKHSSFVLPKQKTKKPHIVVLDIEVSLKAIDEGWDDELEKNGKKRYQDRIDLLLFNTESGALQFFEVKHFSNKELWSEKDTQPRVVEQVKRYNKQLEMKHEQILDAYKKYIEIARSLFGFTSDELPDPKYIENEVILLVFGFDNDQKNKIEKLLISDKSLNDISSRFYGNPSTASDVWNEKTVKKAIRKAVIS